MENNLTEEQKDMISKFLEEGAEEAPSVNVIRDIQDNPIGPSEGEEVVANVKINPETGEKMTIGIVGDNRVKPFEEKIADMGESIDTIDFNKYNIEFEDVQEAAKEGNLLSDEGFQISEETAVELVKMLNKYNTTGEIKYKDFPEEAKQYFEKYFTENGITGHDVKCNTMRNMVAEAFAEELKSNIQMKKFNQEWNAQLEGIFDKMNKEISPLFMDYNNSREDYIKQLTEKITDEDKKAKAAEILDAIHDAFELTRIIEVAPKNKIKRYFLEKPKNIYSLVTSKYNNNQYNIYDPDMVAKILDKHLKSNNLIPEDDKESAVRVVLNFCLLCSNYKTEDPAQHAFMYYFTYTAVLLEIYKDEEYKKFAPEYLANVMKVIENLRK